MAKAHYVVELTSEERSQLEQLLRKGKVAAYKQRHARILLMADRGRYSRGKMGKFLGIGPENTASMSNITGLLAW
jgi:hypothetical protein